MAYSLDGFYPDPRAGGMRLHTYTSADAIATVNTSGYFDDLSDVLAVRDVIFCTDTATPTTYMVNVLSISAAGVVDVSDGTVIVETDTD
jgi:hypothetical protein